MGGPTAGGVATSWKGRNTERVVRDIAEGNAGITALCRRSDRRAHTHVGTASTNAEHVVRATAEASHVCEAKAHHPVVGSHYSYPRGITSAIDDRP